MALIITTEVITKAPTDHHYDPKQITPHLDFAEDKWVRSFLGNTYFDSLVTAAGGNGGATLAGADATLWTEHLHSICSYAVILESIPYVATKVTSAGVMKNFTSNSASASGGEINELQKSMISRLKQMMKIADDWLIDTDRSANYPDYLGNVDAVNNLQHNFGILGL